MIVHEPMTLCTKGRIYTTERQRRRLDIDGSPQGTEVAVGLAVVDRSPSWGTVTQSAQFTTTLAADGEIYVPAPVRDHLDIDVDDHVRLTCKCFDYAGEA